MAVDFREYGARLEGELSSAQTADRGWVVQPGPACRIAPLPGTTVRPLGYLNCPGNTNAHATPLPDTLLTAGDAVILCKSAPADPQARQRERNAYWPVETRSAYSRMLPIVMVPYTPHRSQLRPPAIGNSTLTRLLRTNAPYMEQQVQHLRLPSVVDLPRDDLGGYLARLFAEFCGEVGNGWSTDTVTPYMQHPGYGRELASCVSLAALHLVSTATDKRELARNLVQWGIDLVGAFLDNRVQYPDGGHCLGRLAIIVLAGHLLGGIPAAGLLRSIANKPIFAEDQRYRRQDWWFPEWNAGWAQKREPPNDGRLLSSPPSAWGNVSQDNPRSWANGFRGYYEHSNRCQVGTALAMRILGLTGEMGIWFDRAIEQWMLGPPQAAKDQLAAVGITPAWGTDWALVRGEGLCAAAWRSYTSSRPLRGRSPE